MLSQGQPSRWTFDYFFWTLNCTLLQVIRKQLYSNCNLCLTWNRNALLILRRFISYFLPKHQRFLEWAAWWCLLDIVITVQIFFTWKIKKKKRLFMWVHSRCCQMDQVTHFLDASTIYGSEEDVATSVRFFNNGQLRTLTTVVDRPLLPLQDQSGDGCTNTTVNRRCFLSGIIVTLGSHGKFLLSFIDANLESFLFRRKKAHLVLVTTLKVHISSVLTCLRIASVQLDCSSFIYVKWRSPSQAWNHRL